MAGNVIAFRKYITGQSVYGTQWVGLKYIKMFITTPLFWRDLTNSIILAVGNLVAGFPIPIIFALLLNELSNRKFKRVVQTVSYMPRFISTVVVVGMMANMLNPNTGIVNRILGGFGIQPIFFMNEPSWFRPLFIGSNIWQWTGWSAIIYLAALSAINVELYEAAMIDGAGRFKQVWHVTLPGILPTIVTILIINIGSLLQIGYEKVLMMQTGLNMPVSDILDTYVYRLGITGVTPLPPNQSLATAVGLFNSVVGLILILSANTAAKKVTDNGLF